MSRKLDKRIALITGASRGIGAAVALRFAEEGAHLILTARTIGGLEEVDNEIQKRGGSATLLPLDLNNFDAIDQMGAAIYKRFGRLDVLVSNAAMLGMLSPIGHLDPTIWEDVIRLNLTVNYRLIRSLDPLLRISNAGRAIFVTAEDNIRKKAFWSAYAASKAGLDAMVRCYADEVESTSIRVNLLDPGPTRTNFRKQAFPGENPYNVKLPNTITDLFVELSHIDCKNHGDIIHPS